MNRVKENYINEEMMSNNKFAYLTTAPAGSALVYSIYQW